MHFANACCEVHPSPGGFIAPDFQCFRIVASCFYDEGPRLAVQQILICVACPLIAHSAFRILYSALRILHLPPGVRAFYCVAIRMVATRCRCRSELGRDCSLPNRDSPGLSPVVSIRGVGATGAVLRIKVALSRGAVRCLREPPWLALSFNHFLFRIVLPVDARRRSSRRPRATTRRRRNRQR